MDRIDELKEKTQELSDKQKEHIEGYKNHLYEQLAVQGSMSKEDRKSLQSSVKHEAETLTEISLIMTASSKKASAAADEVTTRMKEGSKSGRRKLLFHSAPANSVIDYEEQQINSFAKGMNFYKIALLLTVGSFVGVVLETLWCLITNGYIESRQGLVYGPFNLLYGAGAVFMSLALYKYRNRSHIFSFFGGFIVGSALEYFCSLFQEMLIGSVSWDYSSMPYNIQGRICLLYSIFWGFLGVIWIKSIYPRVAKSFLKIPNRIGKIVTVCMVVFLAFDSAVSMVAVKRWTDRRNGIAADNSFEQFVDQRFTDQRMETIYANMTFNDQKTVSADAGNE